MKLLLIPVIAAVLMPAAASAAPGKLFGGFPPKKKIVLVVVDRESVRTRGVKVVNDAPIPKGVPEYSLGDNVTLKIGQTGALLIDNFKIPFRRDTDGVNYYSSKAPSSGAKGNSAKIKKSANGKNAVAAEVTFYTYRAQGTTLITNKVTYQLAK